MEIKRGGGQRKGFHWHAKQVEGGPECWVVMQNESVEGAMRLRLSLTLNAELDVGRTLQRLCSCFSLGAE